MNIAQTIATELALRPQQVEAAIALLDDGATVPFIARYRKEATGGIDDTQLRHLEQRLSYLRELEERRAVVLRSIEEQSKLTPELEQQILAVETKQALEDLYLPFKPKRRTKAQIAREAGLEPLAMGIWQNPALTPEAAAKEYVDADRNVPDVAAALEGARQILLETFAEDAALLATLRDLLWQQGVLGSTVIPGKEDEGKKFTDYFDYREPVRTVPSHRALALFRGRATGMLSLALDLPDVEAGPTHPAEARIALRHGVANEGRPADAWLMETVRWTWRVKLHHTLTTDLFLRLREAAEQTAIEVFARNLNDLLLAAPAGAHVTMGLDPGVRTGVKVAVVDATGKLLETATVYPHAPRNDWAGALAALSALVSKHAVELIGIGNGTASRETEKLAADLIASCGTGRLTKLVVSEAGASVYSASALAAEEFPDLDVSLRGAVSIARRLQDPLAELVKIDPKAIGVGQYQHDVNQVHLGRALTNVVEDCVNAVGVNVNTASPALLTHVSGLSSTLARNIVSYRDEHGAFERREQILSVPRMGAKTFEQAAGFLRIMAGSNALDASAVHPEAYPVVERLLAFKGGDVRSLIGDTAFLRSVDPAVFTDERFGLPTVQDILKELEKPGRDPRPEFKTATFKDGVNSLQDLQPGMLLEGVVTNVTNFGAFVDIGVHQDGLVHISALSDSYVKDPRQLVSAGKIVKVKVLDVDLDRKRIALTMRLTDEAAKAKPSATSERAASEKRKRSGPALRPNRPPAPEPAGALALALRAATRKPVDK